MKATKLITLMAVLLAVVSSSDVFAQGRNSQIELYGGAAFAMKPDEFKDYFKMGLSLNGQYVMFPSPNLGISFGVGFERFTVDEEKFLGDITFGFLDDIQNAGFDPSASLSAQTIKIAVGLRPYLTQPEAPTQFFLFGQASYNFLKAKFEATDVPVGIDQNTGNLLIGDLEEESDDNKFGVGAGAGLELPAGSSMNLIFQGLFNIIFTDEENTSFIGVTAGLVF
jgi:hypothetical protein